MLDIINTIRHILIHAITKPTCFSQRRRIRILHTLIHPHELLARALRNLNKLAQVAHSAVIQVMHNDQVPALLDIALERVELLLRGARLGPQPILNVNAPVHDIRAIVARRDRQALTHARTLVAEGRTEVRRVQPLQRLVDGGDVLVVLPVDGLVVGEALHLRVRVRVQGDLVARGHHLVVDVGQVCAGVEQGGADGEEGDLDVFFLDDLEDLLRVLGGAVVDGEGEAVGPLAGEDEVARGELARDGEAGGDGADDFDLAERDGVGLVEALDCDTDDAFFVDVEVVDRDVDVRVGGVAGGLDRVPRLRVGGDGLVACRVVLLQSDGEGVGAGVGDVEVAAVVRGHVAAGA